MNNNPRPGLTKFNLDNDEILPPTPAQRVSAKAEAERIGFTPDVQRPAPVPPPRPVRTTFDTNFHIRTTAEDRSRFDDFAWRHRITKGEAMTRILDLALANEKS
ncbi:MAG: hypothetical protein M3N26_09715 [Pseudomonadota bacterium]|nr:hypothetical protein [Pseudomonadota bacterium]